MTAEWIADVSHRLEMAADILREIAARAWVSSGLLRLRLCFLGQRIAQASRRLAFAMQITSNSRRRYLRRIEDLHAAAVRCLGLTCTEECGAAYEGVEIVASELASIAAELRTLEHLHAERLEIAEQARPHIGGAS